MILKFWCLCLLSFLCHFTVSTVIPWPAKEQYYNQIIDHFNFLSNSRGFKTKFKQRFLYEDKWYKPGGPIFFYCGNEGAIDAFWNNTGLMFELAPTFNAMIIFGEHRYYGKSLPYKEKSFKQPFIKFLSVEQALADYVYLINYAKGQFNISNSSVIAFGGSYGGMLAAYMRFKYPNIVLGSLAASAPLLWVSGLGDFHQFFDVITLDFHKENPTCVNVVRDAFQLMIKYGSQGRKGLDIVTGDLKLCEPLTTEADLIYSMKWLRNAFVMLAMMNYPYQASFMGNLPAHPVRVSCQKLITFQNNSIIALRKAAAVFYGEKSCYYPDELFIECADITGCGLGFDSLAWDFQACTEMNLYDDSNPRENDMFPYLPFDRADVKKYCQKKWEVNLAYNQLRLLMWGEDVKTATNIIFSNGDLDPWSLGGILSNSSLSSSSIALMVKGGAHHLDLRGSNPADPPSVKEVRAIEANTIRNWLKNN